MRDLYIMTAMMHGICCSIKWKWEWELLLMLMVLLVAVTVNDSSADDGDCSFDIIMVSCLHASFIFFRTWAALTKTSSWPLQCTVQYHGHNELMMTLVIMVTIMKIIIIIPNSNFHYHNHHDHHLNHHHGHNHHDHHLGWHSHLQQVIVHRDHTHAHWNSKYDE